MVCKALMRTVNLHAISIIEPEQDLWPPIGLCWQSLCKPERVQEPPFKLSQLIEKRGTGLRDITSDSQWFRFLHGQSELTHWVPCRDTAFQGFDTIPSTFLPNLQVTCLFNSTFLPLLQDGSRPITRIYVQSNSVRTEGFKMEELVLSLSKFQITHFSLQEPC